MPGPTESTLLNDVKIFVQGLDQNGNPKIALIKADRSIAMWAQLVGRNSKGQRVAELDPYDLLRVRPYEPVWPITSILMPASLTTAFTSTDARSVVRVDVVNTDNDPDATCHIVRDVDGGTGNFDICASGTPVPQGIGFRLGEFHLDDGGVIKGSSNPANSCTLTVTVERFSPTGDTP